MRKERCNSRRKEEATVAELIPVCSVNALSCKHFETGMSSKTVNLALIKNTFSFSCFHRVWYRSRETDQYWLIKITSRTQLPSYISNRTEQRHCTHTTSVNQASSHRGLTGLEHLPSLISPLWLVHTRKRCPLTFGWQDCVVTNALGRKCCCLQVILVSSLFPRSALAHDPLARFVRPRLSVRCVAIRSHRENSLLLTLENE